MFSLRILREGALIWFMKHAVTARVARATIGMESIPDYDETDWEHVMLDLNGQTFIDLEYVSFL